MKRDELRNLGLADEMIDTVMRMNGQDIEREQGKHQETRQELNTVHEQLKGYKDLDIDGLKTAASEWETRCKQMETDHAAKIAELEYGHAVSDYVGGLRFTSGLARDAVVSHLKGQNLKLEGGKLMGADEIITQLRKDNPLAFEHVPSGGAPFSGMSPAFTPQTQQYVAQAAEATEPTAKAYFTRLAAEQENQAQNNS